MRETQQTQQTSTCQRLAVEQAAVDDVSPELVSAHALELAQQLLVLLCDVGVLDNDDAVFNASPRQTDGAPRSARAQARGSKAQHVVRARAGCVAQQRRRTASFPSWLLLACAWPVCFVLVERRRNLLWVTP